MTDITPTDPRRTAMVSTPPLNERQKRARAIAKTLTDVHTKYLAPFQRWEALGARIILSGDHTTKSNRFVLWLQRPAANQPGTEEQRAESIARLQAVLDEGPPLDAVQTAYSETLDALETYDTRQVRTLIGIMLDAFPNARPHSPETWMEAVVHELSISGFAVMHVAKACNMLTRSERFAPSVAEVVARCEDVQSFTRAMLDAADRYELQRKVYEKIIAWLREVPLWSIDSGQRVGRPEFDLDYDPFNLAHNPMLSAADSGRVPWV